MNIKYKIFSFLTLLVPVLSSFAQETGSPTLPAKKYDNKNFQFKIEGAENQIIYLGNYFAGKLYYADTTLADNNGWFSFKERDREEGKYAVITPGPKYFDIIVADDEAIHMETDTADFAGNMVVKSSENNQLLYAYIGFLNDRRAERDSLSAIAATVQEGSGEAMRLNKRMEELNQRVSQYQKDFLAENEGKFVATEIKLSLDVQVPDSLKNNEDDPAAAYRYYRDHYWDNTDLSDGRIVRTPMIGKRLENYLTKVLLQDPDTIIAYMLPIIEKVSHDPELYKYFVHTTTYNLQTSKIMNMDKGFVYMIDHFYRDKEIEWLDSTQYSNIIERADKLKPLLAGKNSPVLSLPNPEGEWINLHRDIKSTYTVLCFYDPDCGHCKKEMPVLVEFYNEKAEEFDLEVLAVCSNGDEKWLKFIEEYKTGDFVNLAIPPRVYEDQQYATELVVQGKTNLGSLNYHDTFDVYATPKVFLLDKDKKIIAKQLNVDQLEKFITHHQKVNKKS